MSALLVGAAALVAGYLLGGRRLPDRLLDAVQEWADRQAVRGRAGRWAVQPVYLVLIVASFFVNPARFVRNVRSHRADRALAPAPAVAVDRIEGEQR